MNTNMKSYCFFRRVPISNQSYSITPTTWSLSFVRNKMRYHFPHPNETKRIKKHGWNARMATLGGRKIIMRRILKGKHVLSH